jgi:hypothetical protein
MQEMYKGTPLSCSGESVLLGRAFVCIGCTVLGMLVYFCTQPFCDHAVLKKEVHSNFSFGCGLKMSVTDKNKKLTCWGRHLVGYTVGLLWIK